MINNCWYKVVLIVCACGIISGGCRTSSGLKAVGYDDVAPEEIPFVLGERFEDVVPVAVEFSNVRFDFDNYQIKASEVSKVEKVADYMRRNPGIRLVTEGHCDERGSREYNLSLGEHRALAVRAYLIGLNIQSSRIQTKSYGEERPFDPGHNESAWRRNRRVEFVFYR